MSLRGPLRAKKGYLKTILQPHNITLMSIVEKAPTMNPAYYEFIWRTPTMDSRYALLEEVIEEHMNEYNVRVEPSTLRVDKFAKVRGRNLSYVYQHKAIVEFSEHR
ncbi:MAG: hypothetical protein ACFFF4_12180 [Candidatus Thorarchaeota archaeon]